MPRAVYKKYYDHDDRASGSSNIRKVSFMNGVGGRVKKNRHKFPNNAMLDDGDVNMGGNERKQWNNRKKNKKQYKGRPGSPTMRNPNFRRDAPLTLSDWYLVKLFYGAKYNEHDLHRLLLKHLAPHVFKFYFSFTNENHFYFYTDNYEVAVTLRNANRKILLEDGHLLVIRVKEGVPSSVPVDETIKSRIKAVMSKRYVAETKALDLTKFANDPSFADGTFCPLTRPPIMRAVWQIISEYTSDIVAINLSSNKLVTFDDSLSIEIKKLKNLRIVYLEDNKIKNISAFNCFKESEVTELELRKNPLKSFFKDNTHYVSEIRKKFPKLTKLDGMELPPVISFDVAAELITQLPTPQAAFICNPDGRGIVKAFLSQYFAIYDSDNRLDLAQAYHDTSAFSLCSFYPPNQKSNIVRLNRYTADNRNLFRVTDYPRRKERLQLGKRNIVEYLSKLPKSQHDLSSFAVDLSLFTPLLINLFVSGVFREPSPSTSVKSWPVRHFSRAFLIVPVGQGFCIINDTLFITNATEDQVRCSFIEESQNTSVLQSPPQNRQIDQAVANLTSAVGSVELNDTVRLQMVETLATKTGMNVAWSKKCLDETNWDFDRAIWTFTQLQSKGSIPPEAFVKC
ncbi:Nuclear RNA export factor, putative [Pediculus humanus corporis]|uniref:Nuclear RNA export factor, putative n=1 Tax=Pediculus humanus subsp. corporis TaxID=121224 RepID=E0VI83_PEDHC|nr:Nuclear RNA export factor, putative [Pediculus humanus corporis]EEB13089.1 Nuclear RNA export factor, putative [Pediculus humanus corporis]